MKNHNTIGFGKYVYSKSEYEYTSAASRYVFDVCGAKTHMDGLFQRRRVVVREMSRLERTQLSALNTPGNS